MDVVHGKIILMEDGLTPRQREILDFITEKILGVGYPPTVREIGQRMRILSPNAVVCHLKALERKRFIRRVPNLSRAITLTGPGTVVCPTCSGCGRVKETP